MAAYNKFNQFVEDLGDGVHHFKTAGDLFKVYLSNATPSASLDLVKTDLAEITAQNGYPSGGSDIQNDASETSGTLTVTAVDVVWTGTTTDPAFGPFQYVALYNDTSSSPLDPLVAWWDYGSAISINNGETFTVDFGASLLTIA